MKMFGAVLLFLLALASPALAQNPQTVKLCVPTSATACASVTATAPLPVTGTFSATLAGFTPNGNYTTLTATAASSASTALPAGTVVAFQNLSTIDVSCVLTAGASTATTNKLIVRGGATVYYTVGSNTTTACINQTGVASNVVGLAGGAGLGTAFGGGGSGGGGGAVTMASGAVASGAYAAGSIAAGAYVSGSILSGALASGAVVDLTNLSTPITPATATATKGALLGMQYNSTQATFTNGQQGSVQGSSRGALYVATGADAFAVNATLGAETTKVVGTVRLLGNVGGVLDAIGQNVAAPANWLQAGCQFQTSPTAITATNGSPLQCNNGGKLLVSDTVAQGSLATIATNSGLPVPVNVNTVTTAQTGLTPGVTQTGTIIAANIDLSSVKGTATDTNSGNKSAGTQRNVLATDQLALAAWGQVATGAAPPAGTQYVGANTSGATGGLVQGLIQCDSKAIYDASTNGSTELVALTSGRSVYVCGYSVMAGGTVNVKLIYGTGAACATGSNNLSPAWQLTAQAGISDPSPFYRGMKTASANALCINTSAGVAAQAIVYYSII